MLTTNFCQCIKRKKQKKSNQRIKHGYNVALCFINKYYLLI